MISNEPEPEPTQIKTLIESFKSSITSTWDKEGKELLSDSKLTLTTEEKQTISALLILESPSPEMRRKLWLIASGARREMLNNPGYYHSLLNSSIESPSMKTIDLDLHRTFGHEEYFRLEGSSAKLRNVLRAISRRLLSIGYCQGFNFMVGRILHMCDNEEETFWIFIQIVEKYLQLNYYTDLTGLMTDCIIISRILTNIFPEVMQKLEKSSLDLPLTNYLFKTLLCLFAENINEAMLQTIWDVFFLKGDITLFKAIICLIKTYKKKLLSIKTMSAINTLFTDKMHKFDDKETMLYFLLVRRYDFSKESIDNNREIFFPTLKARLIKVSSTLPSMTEETESNKEQTCDINSPLCINEASNNYHSVFVLRQAESQISIRKYYFFKECKEYPFGKEAKSIIDTYPSLLIERSVHSCQSNKAKHETPSLRRLDSYGGSGYLHSIIKEINS